MRMLENCLENGLLDVWKARWRDVLMDRRMDFLCEVSEISESLIKR